MTYRAATVVGAAALALLLALALGVPADATSPGPADHVGRHAERLGLDGETRRAIAELAEASRARQSSLWEEVREERERLRAMLAESGAEREAILAQSERIDELKARAHRERLEATLRIHDLLTPAQREELVRIRGERGGGRGCGSDLARLCPEAGAGPAALRCLADRFEELSGSCRRSLERLAGGGKPGPQRGLR